MTAHGAAADAIGASAAAAQNVKDAQAAADQAQGAANAAQKDADTAKAEADQASKGAAKTAGAALASAKAASAARDSAAAIVAPANQAILLGSPFQETDSSAGLAVLVAQDSKSLAQQQDAAAQAASGEAAAAAAAAQKLADQAGADAKAAATAAAQAAQDAANADASVNAARKSAADAATDANAAQAADVAATGQANQAGIDAAAADIDANTAASDAAAAAASASDAEKDAGAAHAAAAGATHDASDAKDLADAAQHSAASAQQSAAAAQTDAQHAQDIASAATQLAKNPPAAPTASSPQLGDDFTGIETQIVGAKTTGTYDNCDPSPQFMHCHYTVDGHVTGTYMFYLVTCDGHPNASAAECRATGHFNEDFIGSEAFDQPFHQTIDINVWDFDKNVISALWHGMTDDYVGCVRDLDFSKCAWAAATTFTPVILKGTFQGVRALRVAMVAGDVAGMDGAVSFLANLGKDGITQAFDRVTLTKLTALVDKYKTIQNLVEAGKLGPTSIPAALADICRGWTPFGSLTREQFVAKYWDSTAVDARNPFGNWDWARAAPNNGRVPGTEASYIPKLGEIWDRFGGGYGRNLSPVGTPYGERAIPPSNLTDGYHKYKWIKALDAAAGTVTQSKVAPAFEQAGGGMQFQTSLSVDELIAGKYIVEVS